MAILSGIHHSLSFPKRCYVCHVVSIRVKEIYTLHVCYHHWLELGQPELHLMLDCTN